MIQAICDHPILTLCWLVVIVFIVVLVIDEYNRPDTRED